jgi:cytochrome c-type biogenesis protein
MEAQVHAGIAFLAGIVSFLSPCVLPLIPAYVSVLTGGTLGGPDSTTPSRRAAIVNTIGFVLGFSIVFVALGVFFSSSLGLLGNTLQIINYVAGGIVIVLGLNFIFEFIPFLNYEKRFRFQGTPTNMVSAGLFGMAFAAGWAPCIGPILTSILFLAGSEGNATRGIVLLSLYSLGLGVPFLLAGIFSTQVLPKLARLRPYLPAIKVGSGILLVLLGLLIVSGQLQQFNNTLFAAAYALESWEQANPMLARAIIGAALLLLAGLLGWRYVRRVQRDGGEKPVRPVRAAFTLVFAAASLLSFLGVVDISSVLAAWLSFQGI